MTLRRWLRRAILRLRTLLHRDRVEEELNSELQFHIEQRIALEMAGGATREEARRSTMHALGGLEQVKEECRDIRRMTWIEEIGRDVLFACRSLRQSPGFTSAAVVILALGIGMNATVFSLTSSVLFKGFPLVERNDRLVYIGSNTSCCPSYPDFLDWKAQAKSFTGMALVHGMDVTLTDRAGFPERCTVTYVTANTFRLAGPHPVLGRDFAPSDETPGANPVAIIRYSFWEKRFGRDPGVIGRVVHLEGVPTTIVGVMPRGFSFPQNQDIWAPIVPTPDIMRRENRDSWFAFGRLADGVSVAAARAEMATIGKRLEQEYPATNKGFPPMVQDFQQFFVGPSATLIYQSMWGAVGFLLLIVCANLASLLLSRATGRAREISVRLALGAGRGRIVRQLLVESMLLSGAGGFCGWMLSRWGLRIYNATLNGSGVALGISADWFDNVLDYSADSHLIGYLIAISIATGLLFGLAPALRMSRLDANDARKDGARGATAGAASKRWSALLVGAEVAIAVVLLAGAGLMVRSFLHIYSGDLGFRTNGIISAFFSLPQSRYAQPGPRVSFFERLQEKLQAIPGVESATFADTTPGNEAAALSYELEAAQPAEPSQLPKVSRVFVGTAYFQTLGLAIRSGRDFRNAMDAPSGQPVVIVNHLFAARNWPGQNAVGKRLRLFGRTGRGAWLTVVGIAPDIAQNSRREFAPVVYAPYRQAPGPTGMRVLVRTRLPEGSLERAFRAAVGTVDPNLAVVSIASLDGGFAPVYRYRGVIAALFVVFGAVALVLASTGLCAVTAHAVSRRTQEIGIRMAIGATRNEIRSLVLRQGTLPLWVGLAAGLAASAAVNRVLKSVLVSVSPTDPFTYVIVSMVLIAASVLGCILPATRAARVDPAIALRNE